MSIRINGTQIRKIVVENTEVFSVYKKFINDNQCIWVKPFYFTKNNTNARVTCTPGQPEEPSVSRRIGRPLSITDTVFAFETIEWNHSYSFIFSHITNKINNYPWKCEISFLNELSEVGKKTVIYSTRGWTPSIIDSSSHSTPIAIRRNFFSNQSAISLYNSISCDDTTITLSDFTTISFSDKKLKWTTEDCNYSIERSSLQIQRPSQEVAMFPHKITVSQLFPYSNISYWIEPLVLQVGESKTFYINGVTISFSRDTELKYSISTLPPFIRNIDVIMESLWTATEMEE